MCLAHAGQVDERVEVTIQPVTVWAAEYPLGEAQVGAAITADRAELALGIPAVGFYDLAAAPGLFVVQLAVELGPAGIGDGAGQPVIAQHPVHMQVLDDEAVVSLDQLVAHLVCEMSAHIGDTAVIPRQPTAPG